jgi:hypothetical protein
MPIMDQKSVRVLARYCFPKLLDRPLGRGMLSHADANQAAGTAPSPLPRSHRPGASERGFARKCSSSAMALAIKSIDRLQASMPAPFAVRSDAELQPEFAGNTLLAPGWIVTNHFRDELTKILW